MGLGDTREQIKATLGAVEGIGVVHDYDRWAVDWKTILDRLKDPEGRINAWTISRTKTDDIEDTRSHNLRIHHWRIRGVYGLKDANATELTFQDLVEDICDAIRAKRGFNGTVDRSSAVQVPMIDVRMFGGVLCHYCELTFTTEGDEAWGS